MLKVALVYEEFFECGSAHGGIEAGEFGSDAPTFHRRAIGASGADCHRLAKHHRQSRRPF